MGAPRSHSRSTRARPAKKSRTKPRKIPTQSRSRVTVDAIVTATTQLLVARGYDGATTDRIARAAGVSVGSLYQYFPTKEALLAAVMVKHVEDMMAIALTVIAEAAGQDLRTIARALVVASVRAHAENWRLHKVLAEEVPRVGRLPRVVEIETQLRSALGSQLADGAERGEARAVRVEVAAMILYRAVDAATHTAVLEEPSLLHGDALIDELTELIVRYLEPDRRG
jgi:AcrR family transcriptional regulator